MAKSNKTKNKLSAIVSVHYLAQWKPPIASTCVFLWCVSRTLSYIHSLSLSSHPFSLSLSQTSRDKSSIISYQHLLPMLLADLCVLGFPAVKDHYYPLSLSPPPGITFHLLDGFVVSVDTNNTSKSNCNV